MPSEHEFGRHGEATAAAMLQERGYAILEHNWRCELGEADIVALHENELVIVEVKTRHGPFAHDRALESITSQKRARLFRLGEAYYAQHEDDLPQLDGLRVDVVVVAATSDGSFFEVYPGVGW